MQSPHPMGRTIAAAPLAPFLARPVVLVLGLTLAATACGDARETTTDTTAMAPAMSAPMTVAPTLSTLAGSWATSAMLTGVEQPVLSTLASNADGSSWSISFEGRPNVPAEVTIVGDSMIVQSAEYESVLRAGVMVRVRLAAVLSNDMLMGNLVATYTSASGDEQVPGTFTAKRTP